MEQRAADGTEAITTERGACLDRLFTNLLRTDPLVRAELVDAARARLVEGTRPSALDLAELLLDELVGDLQH
ncbi:MAG: hypothetical protein QOE63_60 [Acidimicrobiaceae bacterium]|jgi:hypothetical protein